MRHLSFHSRPEHFQNGKLEKKLANKILHDFKLPLEKLSAKIKGLMAGLY